MHFSQYQALSAQWSDWEIATVISCRQVGGLIHTIGRAPQTYCFFVELCFEHCCYAMSHMTLCECEFLSHTLVVPPALMPGGGEGA